MGRAVTPICFINHFTIEIIRRLSNNNTINPFQMSFEPRSFESLDKSKHKINIWILKMNKPGKFETHLYYAWKWIGWARPICQWSVSDAFGMLRFMSICVRIHSKLIYIYIFAEEFPPMLVLKCHFRDWTLTCRTVSLSASRT